MPLIMIRVVIIRRIVVVCRSFRMKTHFSPGMIISTRHLTKLLQRCVRCFLKILFSPNTFQGCSSCRKRFQRIVPSPEVNKGMQSLTSKDYIKTQFSWQWYYVLMPKVLSISLNGMHLFRPRLSTSDIAGPRHRLHIHLLNKIVSATCMKAAR
jgi:hypothetical protein